MKINGIQVVPGMYVYDENHEYTKDDFVVYDGVIYICTQDSKKNIPPESPEYFTVYLGDKGRDIGFQEYLDYLNETEGLPYFQEYLEEANKEGLDFLDTLEGSNKYMSVGMLQAAMSHYLLGPTGKGIIGDYICYDSEGLRVSRRLGETGGGSFTDPETIISQIMFHPSINHALLRVSRLLPEINGYVGDQWTSDFSEVDQKSVLLRQYTYLQEGSGNKIRLQELIDPLDGVIWYRSGVFDNKVGASTGDWKCSVGNSRALKSKVEKIIGVYTSRLKVMKSLEEHLRSNFRYRKLSVLEGRPTSFTYEGEEEYPELTLTVSKMTKEGYLVNYQTTINLGDTLGGEIPYYLVGDEYLILVTKESNKYTLSLLRKDTKEVSWDSWFSGAYYKEYYGLS